MTFAPGLALAALMCLAWSGLDHTTLTEAAVTLAALAFMLWATALLSERLEGWRRRRSTFPDMPCVCSCPGPAHRTIWENGEFKGTTCPVEAHGRHKYAMDLVAGHGPTAL